MRLDQQQWTLICRHLDLLIEKNKLINLTRIDDRESGLVLHVEDSLSALEEMESCPEGSYADLGSGGGFPGISLSIATRRDALLVDSAAKKCKALDEIIAELGLCQHIRTCPERIETLAAQRPGEFGVLTARALSSLSSLLELASPLLFIGGRLIAYKGSRYRDELEAALAIQDKLGMGFVSERTLELSDGTPRSLIVFEKTNAAQVKLPRRPGMAQKRPYKTS